MNFISDQGEVKEDIFAPVVNQGSFGREEVKFQKMLGCVHLEEERSS